MTSQDDVIKLLPVGLNPPIINTAVKYDDTDLHNQPAQTIHGVRATDCTYIIVTVASWYKIPGFCTPHFDTQRASAHYLCRLTGGRDEVDYQQVSPLTFWTAYRQHHHRQRQRHKPNGLGAY